MNFPGLSQARLSGLGQEQIPGSLLVLLSALGLIWSCPREHLQWQPGSPLLMTTAHQLPDLRPGERAQVPPRTGQAHVLRMLRP